MSEMLTRGVIPIKYCVINISVVLCVLPPKFSEVINEALDKFFPPESGVQIIAEPGRYYVESAFTLAANIIAKRVDIDHTGKHNNDVYVYLLELGECLSS